MKKIFFAGLFAVSLAALAATPGQPKKATKSNFSSECAMYQNDTVPGKKKDTTKKPIPDSINLKMQ